jgi:hypothetical protein
VSDDDVGGDDGDAGGRGGGGGDARRSGVATVRDDDVGGDGRDDNESVSRGVTPAPLSAGSGATPGVRGAGPRAARRARRASARARAGRVAKRRATTMMTATGLVRAARSRVRRWAARRRGLVGTST